CSLSAGVVALAIHFKRTELPTHSQVTVTYTPVTTMRTPLLQGRSPGDAGRRRRRSPILHLVFVFRDSTGQLLSETLEYITFFGNLFSDISAPGDVYGVSMNATEARERAINPPACSIQILGDNIFKGMPQLEALYIGENEVFYIDANAFAGLNNLIHLDFSRNAAYDERGNLQTLASETFYVFESLKNMSSLDMSFTKLTQQHVSMLKGIGSQLTRLSLCETGLTALDDEIFNRTSLRILDLSGNYGIFGNSKTLAGLEDTLQILYARDTGLRTMDIFEGFDLLEVLNLSMNEITAVSSQVAKTLKSLQILDLDMNRLTSWFSPVFSLLPSLKLLSLRENNINLISEEMIADIAEVQYLAMSGNFIVCNCHTRDFFDLALQNEQYHNHDIITGRSFHVRGNPEASVVKYHRGFIDFNKQIMHRTEVSVNCTEEICYDYNEEIQANFLIIDYYPTSYMCLLVAESRPIEFSQVDGCNRNSRDIDYDKVIQDNKERLYILLAIPGFLIILIPRRLRPNTLHYLMLTKTYIVWPKDENERALFWRRVKKSIVTMKQRQTPIEG
ncbi:Toll9, partial [Operophtera brumata]